MTRLAILLGLAAVWGCAQPINLAGPWRLQLDDNPRWAQPGIDDSAWPTILLPQRTPRPEHIYWLRRTVPAPASREPLEVTVGLVSESYDVYANGVQIGGTGDFGSNDVRFFQPRSFHLPPELIRPDEPLVIAIRIWNLGVLWGNQAYGVADEGPYWITSPAHAAAELRAARRATLLAITPSLVVLFGMAGIGICLLILWLPERNPKEVVFFAAYLLLYASAMAVGTWTLAAGESSFWWRWGYKQFVLLAYVVLSFAVTEVVRLPSLSRFTIAAVFTASLALQYEWVTAYHILPWAVLTQVQCIRGIRAAPRQNLPFAIPALCLTAATLNNIIPQQWRMIPRTIGPSGLTVSLTNVIQITFAGAMLILLLRRLGEDRREKQRLAAELEAARSVQQLLISGVATRVVGYSLDAVYLPAQEVGGDLYYVLPGDGGGFTLVTGDVSGKGVRAALLVSMIVGALRETRERRPAPLLEALNKVALGQTGGGFVTCFCAQFSADGAVAMANAGHIAPWLVGRETKVEASLPLGIAPDLALEESSLQLGPGEQLTFASDGVVEAANATGELFGFDRTREISGRSAHEIAEAAKAWGQNDDITVVTVRRVA